MEQVSRGVEDYYAGEGEMPGVWTGAGSAAVGLGGDAGAEGIRRFVTVQLGYEEDRRAPRGLTRAELITAREVAELLAVPISTAREWRRNGTLPRFKLGRHVRYIRRHVEAAILDAEEAGPPPAGPLGR